MAAECESSASGSSASSRKKAVLLEVLCTVKIAVKRRLSLKLVVSIYSYINLQLTLNFVFSWYLSLHGMCSQRQVPCKRHEGLSLVPRPHPFTGEGSGDYSQFLGCAKSAFLILDKPME